MLIDDFETQLLRTKLFSYFTYLNSRMWVEISVMVILGALELSFVSF